MGSEIILITGSTGGIRKETAKVLANQGHTVIVHGRNKKKTEAVCDEIKSETGNSQIDFVMADLLLLSQVNQMAKAFKKNTSDWTC